MEQTFWERSAEALLLLYFTREEIERCTPNERRLLAVMQFIDLPDDGAPDDPDLERRRRRLIARLAALPPAFLSDADEASSR
ncbi:MAG: hypothetical protein N2378_03910 [Chloroflexaceae bacterium]|nr:hypothetical protein [Chloroflexaceae bacterium]